MDKVRVCVDAVGGDEPAEVVLAGIGAVLEADADLEVLVAGPEEVIAEFSRRTSAPRCWSPPRSSPWRTTPSPRS